MLLNVRFLTIDQNITKQKPYGYCKYKKAWLTDKQIKVHKCIDKKCKNCINFWDEIEKFNRRNDTIEVSGLGE